MESSSFLIRPGVNVPSLGFTNRQLDISAQPIMAISESSPFDTLLTVTLENGVLTGNTLWPRLFASEYAFRIASVPSSLRMPCSSADTEFTHLRPQACKSVPNTSHRPSSPPRTTHPTSSLEPELPSPSQTSAPPHSALGSDFVPGPRSQLELSRPSHQWNPHQRHMPLSLDRP